MAIQNVVTDFAGQIGVAPRLVRILCNDTYSTVTELNYLSSSNLIGNTILPTDAVFVSYQNNGLGLFQPVINGSGIQLFPYIAHQERANLTAVWGGGGTSHAFTVTGLTANSIVVASIVAQANTASLVKVVPSANTLTVTFSADPGAGTQLSYITFAAAQ